MITPQHENTLEPSKVWKMNRLITDSVGHLPTVPAHSAVKAPLETRSHYSPEADAHTLFHTFQGTSQQQHKTLLVTLICMKAQHRGGRTHNRQRMESLNSGRSDSVGNVLLLLQSEQGQVLKGSRSSLCWQM